MRSAVREQLEQWDGGEGRFIPRQFDSPAAGLRYKVLTLPGKFSIEFPDGPKEFESEMFYAVRGAAKSGTKLKLGLIPVKSDYGSRTANVITKPDNAFWDVDDVDSLRTYTSRQWPHFPIEQLVPEAELARFAADRGGYFPRPQHPSAACWVPPIEGASIGAVLLGDALHAFPPDIGQGVNSALEDVTVLRDVLEAAGDDQPAVAVRDFEATRMPDVEALVQMVRVAAPFQYSQAPWRGRLWSMCFLSRFLLHRVAPRFFALPAFMLVQQSELPYREVWSRARSGARNAVLLLGGLVLGGAAIVFRIVLS